MGHTPQKSGEILNLDYLKCIDTFCHGGGWLTALEVDTGQVWQVDVGGRCGIMLTESTRAKSRLTPVH